MLAILSAVLAHCAEASDKMLLDSLLADGTISYSEASNAAKLLSESVQIKNPETKSISLSGGIQAQFMASGVQSEELSGKSSARKGFALRRAVITAKADLSDSWRAKMSLDFSLSNKFLGTFIAKKIDSEHLSGELRMGYDKVKFMFEENTSAFRQLCAERSLATRYWCLEKGERRPGFGSFSTGVFWNGKIPEIEGFEYGAAVSNTENYNLYGSKGDIPNFWLNASLSKKIGKDSGFKAGINMGYGADANINDSSECSSTWGINPYLAVNFGTWISIAEFVISGIDDSCSDLSGLSKNTFPFGINFTLEKSFYISENIGRIAPVARFSYLYTDGNGVLPSDVIKWGANVSGDFPYNEAFSIYVGANWYLEGESIKFQLGYEYSEFSGGTSSAGSPPRHRLRADTLRAQLQILF